MKHKLSIVIRLSFLLVMVVIGVLALSHLSSKSEKPDYVLYLGNAQNPVSDTSAAGAPDQIRFFASQDNTGFGFVLPGSWDASRLRIYLSGVESVRIGGREYHSSSPVSLTLDRPFNLRPKGCRAIRLTVRQTGGLPVLFIRAESGNSEAIHSDKSIREPGFLQMTDADGGILFEEELSSVRIRGNSTAKCHKKPYQIKLKKAAALIPQREDKTWILLANALDRAQIRNTLALDLARYSGAFAYTPRTQPVDLYLNNEYEGTYLLTEKSETGKNRLAIRDLEKEMEKMNPSLDFDRLEARGGLRCEPGARKYRDIPAVPEDWTGGYLVQLNLPQRYESEECGFVTDRGCPFTMQEPTYTDRGQTDYIASVFQRIEDALYSEDGIDPASGLHFSELLDLSSFVDRYLHAEVLDDFDGQYCYFNKDADAIDPKVYAGPVWDQDNILGVWGRSMDPTVIHIACDPEREWTWFSRAVQHADCYAAIRERYLRVFRPAVDILLGFGRDPGGILRSVDEYAQEVRQSVQTDYFRWKEPLLESQRQKANNTIGDTFDDQIAFLKDYLAKRREAMDGFFKDSAASL